MAKKKPEKNSEKKPEKKHARVARRNYPNHTLREALEVAQKIADEKAGKPFKRLLLADAIGLKPGSSNYRLILSSAYRYGLTDGTEKASDIGLTPLGVDATQTTDATKRLRALRSAALGPQLFRTFFENYREKKLPSQEMFGKILKADYDVPGERTDDCIRILNDNGRFAELVRDIGGSPHVLFDDDITPATIRNDEDGSDIDADDGDSAGTSDERPAPGPRPADPPAPPLPPSLPADAGAKPKPIFIGHGKNQVPLEKLRALLGQFQIPYKVTIKEANLGRPIPQKVRQTMEECGSAILIFTRDEEFFDKAGNSIWRPSENVVHELGATSYAYGDRVVIFKEKGVDFPSNFASIGYIEFEVDTMEAKTAELLKELIGFGLVKIQPA